MLEYGILTPSAFDVDEISKLVTVSTSPQIANTEA